MDNNNRKICSIKNITEDDDSVYHQNIRSRCGEIFLEDDKLKYYCLFCKADFREISTFVKHLYRTHLFMDPPLFEDEKPQVVNVDYAKTNNIKYNNQLHEDNGKFCISENNDQKFDTKDIEDVEIDKYSDIGNDLLDINERGKNLFDDCKSEIVEDEMKTHEDPTHNIEIKKNQCEICFKVLSSERSLRGHQLIHIKNSKSTKINKYNFPKGDDGKFHCTLCTSAYSRIDRLRHHIEAHWGVTNQTKCDTCLKIFSSKRLLQAHIRRAHTGERPHKCNICPAAFADRANFHTHLRIHSGDKRYSCDYCDKTFVQSSEKKIHERIVHTKERPYQCEICGKHFFDSSRLTDHKKRHTNTRKFECEICEKRFYSGYLLKDHKISHSSEKPHTCEICSAKFARRKALSQHIKIHSNVKEYVCTTCNKAFAQRAGLYTHMKLHIGNMETLNNATA